MLIGKNGVIVDVNFAVENIIYKYINHQTKEYYDKDTKRHTNQANLILKFKE